MKTVQQLNAEATELGQEIVMRAIENKDVECIRAFKFMALGLMDVVLEMAKTKPDYPTWYKAFISINQSADISRFDPTGKWDEIQEQLAKLDMTEYYFKEVVPMFAKPIVEVEIARSALVMTFDSLQEMLVQQRRDSMKLV